MSTGKETAKVLRDVKIDVKTKLSALWVVLMFCYNLVWHAYRWPKREA
jgi:hypothetical protein